MGLPPPKVLAALLLKTFRFSSMVNFKNLSLALALVAMLSISLGVPLTTRNAYADVTYTVADATGSTSTGQALYSGSISLYGQKFTNRMFVVNQEVDCMTVSLRKNGSPTGTAYVGVFNTSDRSLVYQFGTKDVSTLTGSYTLYEFCDTSSDGFLMSQNTMSSKVFGVKYEGGDSSNKVDVRRSYVGNTGETEYYGRHSYLSYYDGTWHNYDTEGNYRDLLFKLTNTETDDAAHCNQLPLGTGGMTAASITGGTLAHEFRVCAGDGENESAVAIITSAFLDSNKLYVRITTNLGDSEPTIINGVKGSMTSGETTLDTGYSGLDEGISGRIDLESATLSAGSYNVVVTVPAALNDKPDCGADLALTCDHSGGQTIVSFTVS